MVAFQAGMTGQKTIGFHFIVPVFQLHNERRAQVDEIGITYIGKKRIRKPIRVFGPELIEIGFPEEINEMRKRSRGRYPVVLSFEVVFMEEFYMLHGTALIKCTDRAGWKTLKHRSSHIFM